MCNYQWTAVPNVGEFLAIMGSKGYYRTMWGMKRVYWGYGCLCSLLPLWRILKLYLGPHYNPLHCDLSRSNYHIMITAHKWVSGRSCTAQKEVNVIIKRYTLKKKVWAKMANFGSSWDESSTHVFETHHHSYFHTSQKAHIMLSLHFCSRVSIVKIIFKIVK